MQNWCLAFVYLDDFCQTIVRPFDYNGDCSVGCQGYLSISSSKVEVMIEDVLMQSALYFRVRILYCLHLFDPHWTTVFWRQNTLFRFVRTVRLTPSGLSTINSVTVSTITWSSFRISLHSTFISIWSRKPIDRTERPILSINRRSNPIGHRYALIFRSSLFDPLICFGSERIFLSK